MEVKVSMFAGEPLGVSIPNRATVQVVELTVGSLPFPGMFIRRLAQSLLDILEALRDGDVVRLGALHCVELVGEGYTGQGRTAQVVMSWMVLPRGFSCAAVLLTAAKAKTITSA